MYDRFEKLLKQKGVTAYRVAKETGITTGTLSDWKVGRSTPKQDKLIKIADYFGVTLDYLMGRTDYPNLEVFQKEPNEIITYQKGQKKEAPSDITAEEALRIGLEKVFGHPPTEKDLRYTLQVLEAYKKTKETDD